jgi:hypothetical protein
MPDIYSPTMNDDQVFNAMLQEAMNRMMQRIRDQWVASIQAQPDTHQEFFNSLSIEWDQE